MFVSATWSLCIPANVILPLDDRSAGWLGCGGVDVISSVVMSKIAFALCPCPGWLT